MCSYSKFCFQLGLIKVCIFAASNLRPLDSSQVEHGKDGPGSSGFSTRVAPKESLAERLVLVFWLRFSGV